MKIKQKNVLSNAALLAMSFVFIEFALHLASDFFTRVDRITGFVPPMIEDDILDEKGNSKWWDHDARGFRNRIAIKRASIVAMGDSHTYGMSVNSNESWPSVISSEFNTTVYNMGTPGFGPTHNLTNMEIAEMLQPKLILFGLYFGNDFYDDFRFYLHNDMLPKFLDADSLSKVLDLEKKQNIVAEMRVIFHLGRDKPGPIESAKHWLSRNLRIYSTMQNIKNLIVSGGQGSPILSRDFDRARLNFTDDQLPYVSVYDGPSWKTIFTSPYRLRVIDDSDLRIATGVRISKHVLDLMKFRANKVGSEFVVIFLPTKEYVFWPRVKRPDEHKFLVPLVVKEAALHTEFERFLDERHIPHIDPTEALRHSERQPYFPDGDGHPNAVGHRIIAKKVLEYIRKSQLWAGLSPDAR